MNIYHIGRAGCLVLMLTGLHLVAGCASGPTVISNSDPAFDFAGLESFAFIEPLSTDRGGARTLLSGQLMAATRQQLEDRGMREVQENPDVLINFLFETQQQIRSRPSSAGMSMHRSGRYGTWGGTMATPTVEQITQGALSIDMIDPRRNQLVWEGSAVERVTSRMQQDQEAAVKDFVDAIFSEFPR